MSWYQARFQNLAHATEPARRLPEAHEGNRAVTCCRVVDARAIRVTGPRVVISGCSRHQSTNVPQTSAQDLACTQHSWLRTLLRRAKRMAPDGLHQVLLEARWFPLGSIIIYLPARCSVGFPFSPLLLSSKPRHHSS